MTVEAHRSLDGGQFTLTDEIHVSNGNLLTYPEGIIITPKQRTHWSHFNFLLIHQYYNKSGYLTCYGHYTDSNNNITSELCIPNQICSMKRK